MERPDPINKISYTRIPVDRVHKVREKPDKQDQDRSKPFKEMVEEEPGEEEQEGTEKQGKGGLAPPRKGSPVKAGEKGERKPRLENRGKIVDIKI